MQKEHSAIEEFAMRLATRSYLYGAFHVAFGAKPSAEVVRMLGSRETSDALVRVAHMPHAARVRVESWNASTSATEALLGIAEDLRELEAKANDAMYVEGLASAYTKLFLVPGEAYVYPWESPYVGQETMLFQESTLDVKSRFREYGFAAKAGKGRFPEDHVSMMLDFMARLAARAFDAFSDGDDAQAKSLLEAQEAFAKSHLRTWLPAFSEEVRKKDASGVYASLARSLALFVEADGLFLGAAEAEYPAS